MNNIKNQLLRFVLFWYADSDESADHLCMDTYANREQLLN